MKIDDGEDSVNDVNASAVVAVAVAVAFTVSILICIPPYHAHSG